MRACCLPVPVHFGMPGVIGTIVGTVRTTTATIVVLQTPSLANLTSTAAMTSTLSM